MGACGSKKALQHNDRIDDGYAMIKEPKKQKTNHFPRLKDETIQLIFKHLDVLSLARTHKVCRRFNLLAKKDHVWVSIAIKFKIDAVAPGLENRVVAHMKQKNAQAVMQRMADVGMI